MIQNLWNLHDQVIKKILTSKIPKESNGTNKKSQPIPLTKQEKRKQGNVNKKWERALHVKKLKSKGFSNQEIESMLNIDRRTVAADYTLNRMDGLKAFLNDGRIEIDNNPAENAIRPNVIGRKNWLFSVSEAGAKANAICLSIAETAKANGVDFCQYLLKLLTDLPNSDIHRNSEILSQYMPWSKVIQKECGQYN